MYAFWTVQQVTHPGIAHILSINCRLQSTLERSLLVKCPDNGVSGQLSIRQLTTGYSPVHRMSYRYGFARLNPAS
jgi:hypothetical protein